MNWQKTRQEDQNLNCSLQQGCMAHAFPHGEATRHDQQCGKLSYLISWPSQPQPPPLPLLTWVVYPFSASLDPHFLHAQDPAGLSSCRDLLSRVHPLSLVPTSFRDPWTCREEVVLVKPTGIDAPGQTGTHLQRLTLRYLTTVLPIPI